MAAADFGGGGMQPSRVAPPVRLGQVRRGGGLVQRRVVAVGVQPPQWCDGDHIPKWNSSGDLLLSGEGDNQGDVQGNPMPALAGNDFQSPWAVPSPSCDGPSSTFELAANGNSSVNGNGYFSNMLMNETDQGNFENDGHTFTEQQSQLIEGGAAAPSARPNHKRAKNFSDHEDEVLVSAWLNVSLDPVSGKDQKAGKYWSRIHNYFHEHKTCSSTRTINSLMHRWETIQRFVNKFCSCLAQIERRQQSGTTIQGKVVEACAFYKSQDPHNKPFQFMHCWNKLRTQPKWLSKLDELAAGKTSNKKQKTGSIAEPSASCPMATGQGEAEGTQVNALARPDGRKKSKAEELREKKRNSVAATIEKMWAEVKEVDEDKEIKKKEDRFNKVFALEQERVALKQERVANEKLLAEVRSQEVQLQKKRDEERIMTMDLSAMPEEQNKYYMCLRVEIMSWALN